MPQAFEGIRILDFTQVLAGPFAVMQLALLGAEVIKVEQPGGGDQTRELMNTGKHPGMSPAFMGMNLNKRSITLDLKSVEAVTIIKKLIASTDVLVENFRAGTMERMELGYEDLKKIKPDLIYCSVTGYGQTGPKAGEAAYDGAIQASSGMMSQTGHPETGPTRTGFMPVDMATGLYTAFAISASIHRKTRTGQGQKIDLAMMDSAIVVQAAQYNNYFNQGRLVGLLGNSSPTLQPTADVFPTKDGFIQVTALNQSLVEKLFTSLGRKDDLQKAAFASTESRIENKAQVHELINEALGTKTTSHWMRHLSAAGIPVAEVRELPEVANDSQFEHRRLFETIPSPLDSSDTVTLVKAGFITDKDGPQVRNRPPLLGEHTIEILKSLSYSAEDIAAFKANGVT